MFFKLYTKFLHWRLGKKTKRMMKESEAIIIAARLMNSPSKDTHFLADKILEIQQSHSEILQLNKDVLDYFKTVHEDYKESDERFTARVEAIEEHTGIYK